MSNDDSSEILSERRQQYGGRPTTTKDDAREVPGINGKYSGLSRLATHYNRQFSEQQHHAYGCNCMMIGDRPMLQTSFGPPVDALDATCKKLKDCYKCVSDQFGSDCNAEDKNYDFFVRGQNILAGNKGGTCERALFECDHQYAKQLTTTIHTFDIRYNLFATGFDPVSESGVCGGGAQSQNGNLVFGAAPSSTGSSALRELVMTHDIKCCGGPISPFIIYDANVKKCCKDGTVKTQC